MWRNEYSIRNTSTEKLRLLDFARDVILQKVEDGRRLVDGEENVKKTLQNFPVPVGRVQKKILHFLKREVFNPGETRYYMIYEDINPLSDSVEILIVGSTELELERWEVDEFETE